MKRITAALFTLLLPTALFATNGYLQTGTGVKSKGMGGVGVALPQDAFVSAMNPAGLIRVCNRWDVGLHWWENNGRLTDGVTSSSETFIAHTHENLYWPEAAISYAFCPNLSAGVAFYASGGFRTNYGETQALSTTSGNLSSEYNVYVVTPSLSWQINCMHSLGVAVNIGIGYLSFTGMQGSDNSAQSVAPTYLTNNGNNWSTGIGIRLGWLGQISPKLALGFTYQSKTWMNHYADYRGFLADDGNFDLPSQWGFGISYKCLPCLVTSIDIVRVLWTDVKMFGNDVNRTGRFGAINGPGFGWKDQWIVKGGIAYTFCKYWTVRGGWNYGDQLFGGPETLINAIPLEPVEHFASLGLTWACGCWEASVDYAYGLRHGVEFGETRKVIAYENSVGVSFGRRF